MQLVLVLTFVVVFGIFGGSESFADTSYGKPAWVTNSDKVCGDKLCSEANNPTSKFSHSPREQLESSVLPLDVVCGDLVLTIRPSNGISCLTLHTAEKLSTRGWIIISDILENDGIYKTSLENLIKFIHLFENRTASISGIILKQDIAIPLVMCPEMIPRPVTIITSYKLDVTSPHFIIDGMGNNLGIQVSFSRENPIIINSVIALNSTVTGIVIPTQFAADFCDPYVLQKSAHLQVNHISN